MTPIRYELELDPGETVTLPASIRNNGDTPVTLPTTASDFTTNWTSWVPSLVRKSELVFPDQQLSSWITIADESVSINPGKEITTYFTIEVPENATPGWHYGAILFKNDNSEWSTTWNIGINVDYGILVLVKVSWEIIIDVEIEDPEVNVWQRWVGWTGWMPENISNEQQEGAWYLWEDENGNSIYQLEDLCSFWDFTPSKYDEKCIDFIFSEEEEDNAEPLLFSEDFEVRFDFPINNKWNTHIKPEWKITLRDEDGNIIKAVGKQAIENEKWAVIGEKIVDYIPINDEWGNVLPRSTRIFQSYWKGFPYKEYDEEGNLVVKYWNPSEFYTQKNKQDAGFLMFWERVSEVRQSKIISADIDMTYYDTEGNPINFNSAKDFPVQYIEEKVTFNPYVSLVFSIIMILFIIIGFGARWWIFFAKKKSRCWNCDEEIKSDWEACPYCKKLQDKKKQKILEQQKKEPVSKKSKKKK